MKTDPPTIDDFKSHEALGRVPPKAIVADPDKRRSWDCVSMFDTEEGARRIARASRDMRLGRFIAELRIPIDQPKSFVLWETEGSRGHYDVTATPEALLACVVRVVPV